MGTKLAFLLLFVVEISKVQQVNGKSKMFSEFYLRELEADPGNFSYRHITNDLESQIVNHNRNSWSLYIILEPFEKLLLHLTKVPINQSTSVCVDEYSNHLVECERLQKAMKFQKFSLSIDPYEQASIAVFENKFGRKYLDGFIGRKILKYLPSSRKYILIEKHLGTEVHHDVGPDGYQCSQSHGSSSIANETVTLKLLFLLDWNSALGRTNSEIVKNLLVQFNGLKLMFSLMDSPTIDLTLAGVLIPRDYNSWMASLFFYDADEGYVSISEKADRYFEAFLDNQADFNISHHIRISLVSEPSEFIEDQKMLIKASDGVFCKGMNYPVASIGKYYSSTEPWYISLADSICWVLNQCGKRANGRQH